MQTDPDPAILKRVKKTLNMPAILEKAMQEDRDKNRYHSDSDYLLGLVIFSIWCDREHKLTAPLLREPKRIQNEVIAQLLEDRKNPERKKPGGWFEARIDQLVKEAKAREVERTKAKAEAKKVKAAEKKAAE